MIAAEAALTVRLLSFQARVQGPAGALRRLRWIFPEAGDGRESSPPLADLLVRIDRRLTGWRWRTADSRPRPVAADDHLAPTLDWLVTQRAVAALADRYTLLHAAAVARDGAALLLPGSSGSGKSTLAIALMDAGWQMVGDDIVAAEPASARLLAFRRSPCLKTGAPWALLAGSRPARRPDGERLFYRPPAARQWASGPQPVGAVVFPTYRAGAATTLATLPRVQALAMLQAQTFSIDQRGRRDMGVLTRLLAGAPCFQLTIGDLDQALACLRPLGGRLSERAASGR